MKLMVVYRVENQQETNTSHPTLLQLLCCVLLYFLLPERFPPGRRMGAHEIQEVNKRHVCGKAETNKVHEAPPQGCGNSKQLFGADILPLLPGDPTRSSRDAVFMNCVTF